MIFSLVVDDCVAQKILDFKMRKFASFDEIQKILQYYKKNPLFSNTELLRSYYGDNQLTWVLSQASLLYRDISSIEELAMKTTYKIILTLDKKDGFPYVNVSQSRIENYFCSSFRKEESRDNAILHFKALLKNAKYIIFYDRFLKDAQEAFKGFAQKCFPQKRFNIHINNFDVCGNLCSEIKNICKDWSISSINQKYEEKYSRLHDRYIVIDNKLEIILTSGIEHLMRNDRDFTYILNPL